MHATHNRRAAAVRGRDEGGGVTLIIQYYYRETRFHGPARESRWISMIKNTFSLDLKTFYAHTYPTATTGSRGKSIFRDILYYLPNVCALLYFRFPSSRLSFPSEWRPERETNTTTPGAGNNKTNTCLFLRYIYTPRCI